MQLPSGTRIGSFEVIRSLGAGGMGEVYRARDTRLDRDVAIKVLPESFATDPDRLMRFTREAKTLATLNHPNIAAIYGIEPHGSTSALVMELVDGDDLSSRIGQGALPLSEAFDIARQIADALEAAHEAGVIHRDLKPANIKVRGDGTVKVLDFGLAKAADPAVAASGANPTASPTMTSPAMTAMGLILGTAAYMAPEQARGKPVDRRADIWAFGIVLTEMLTGRPVFQGETVSDVMVSVLSGPIDLSGLPANVPHRVRELIARCLERDPKRRLRDIGEARVALESASLDASTSGVRAVVPADAPVTPSARQKRTLLPWIVAGVSLAVAVATATLWYSAATAQPAGQRLMLEIGPPGGEEFVIGSNAGAAVISPDGSMVAFLAQGSAARRLYVRSLVTGEARAISGSEEASYPFWSPDSRSLAFFGISKLLTVSIAGGLPEAVADIQQGRGGTWTDNGVILFTPRGGGVVHRVGAGGGKVEVVTALDASRDENAHYWPVALPGGRHFLFFVRSSRPENNGIYLGSVDGKTPPVRLVTSLSSGLYAASRDGSPGHVLWVRDGDLLAQPLDIESRRLTGDVRTIASDVRVEESQRGNFASVSANGTIVWASAKGADLELAWFSRDGRKLETLPIAPGKVIQPRISPGGKKLAFTRAGKGTADIWLFDFQSGATTQLTTDPGYDENPAWSPDGNAMSYTGALGQDSGIVMATIDGSRPPRIAISGETREDARFMPNQSLLIVARATDRGTNVVVAPLDNASAPSDVSIEPGYAGQLRRLLTDSGLRWSRTAPDDLRSCCHDWSRMVRAFG